MEGLAPHRVHHRAGRDSKLRLAELTHVGMCASVLCCAGLGVHMQDALRRAQTTPGTSSRLLAACIDVAALVARARGA